MRVFRWFPIVLLSLTGCNEEHVSLKKLLERPDVRLRVSPSDDEFLFAVERDHDDAICPVVSKDVRLEVDGKAPEYFFRGGNAGSLFERKCDLITAAVKDLPPLPRGGLRTFTLREGSHTVTVVMKQLTLATDAMTAAPFPGPGQAWVFTWPGTAPAQVDLDQGFTELRRSVTDGGFQVTVPGEYRGAGSSINVLYEPFVLERCENASCHSTSMDLKQPAKEKE
jgi:hypothetical protein